MKLTKLRDLSRSDCVYLIAASTILPLVRLSIRIWGLKHVYHYLKHRIPPTSILPQFLLTNDVQHIAYLVNAVARQWPFRAPCLTRSLTLWWLLKQQGINSELCIGVRNKGNKFEAHAWLERDGIVLNDSIEHIQKFSAFKRTILQL